MATYNKINNFVYTALNGAQNFASNTYKVTLSNSAITAGMTTFGSLTEIVAGNGFTAGGTATTISTFTQSGGTATVGANVVTFTAAGGAMNQFRYVVLYNSTNNNLVAWWDYGSGVTLQDGETFTVKFNNATPVGTVFTLA